MKLFDIFIRRPVYAAAIAAIVLLIGVFSILHLPLREFPVFTPSKITITTVYPGASPKTMEGYVSTPIQEAIADVDGIDYISAQNVEGKSIITVKLYQGYDIDKAQTQINTKISSILWRLPKAVLSPSITQQGSSSPSIYLSLSGKISQEAISNYLAHQLKPQITNVTGVDSIIEYGIRPYSMRIWLNPKLMTAHNVTALDVQQALQEQNVQAAPGKLKNTMTEYNLSVSSLLETPEEFDNIIVKRGANYLVRLKDVGYASLGAKSNDNAAIAAGKPAVFLGVVPRNNAGNIAVSDRIIKMLPSMRANAPKGMTINVIWNTSQFAKGALTNVLITVGLAILFVIVVIALFLGSVRSVFVPVLTIPLSLLGLCASLLLLGYSFNTMTMLAAALAIGLVVDDSIVVLENTHRHMEEGMSRTKAAFAGLHEIAPAIIIMTLVVAVVFVPIAFTGGITGVLFKEFAIALSCTVLFSGVFALTLSPTMCSHVLVLNPSPKSFTARIDHIFTWIAKWYANILSFVIQVRIALVIALIGLFVALLFMFMSTNSDLLPQEDQGVILGIGVGPTSANLEYSSKYANQMAQIFHNIPEMQSYGVIVGWPVFVNGIVSFVILREHQKGDRTEAEIIKSLGPKLKSVAGITAFPMNRPPLIDITGFSQPVEFVVQTTGAYDQLNTVMQKLSTIAKNSPMLENVQDDLKIDKPAFEVKINRNKAAALGVPVSRISDTLNFLIGKPTVSWFSVEGYSYPVIPQLERKFRMNPDNLDLIHVKNDQGDLIPFSNLVEYQQLVAPQALNQFQQLHSATLTANTAQGYSLGQVLNFLEKTAKEILPSNMSYAYSGESRIFKQANSAMAFLFIGAIIAVYLLMVLKFASFIDPLIVMISVPLSLLGALIAIHLIKANLNIYTEIGLLMLTGLISKQGILIVDFANHIQVNEGLHMIEAVIKAAKIRLRPILMTTFAMIFGAVPLVLTTGAGSTALAQIGWVIIAGLGFGSLLSLFAVPTIYTFLGSPHHKRYSNEKNKV